MGYQNHLEVHGLLGLREDDAAQYDAEVPPPVVNVSAPMQDCAWFTDLSDRALQALLALPTAQRKQQMFVTKNAQMAQQKGYSQGEIIYCDNDAQTLERMPPLDHSPPAPIDPNAPPVAPAVVRVPEKMPHLGRMPLGFAARIIAQFEDVVVVGSETYSPMRLWTLEHRRVHNQPGQLMSQTTLFGRRCRTYTWIRFFSGIADPVNCQMSETNLRHAADTWHKDLPEEEKALDGFVLALKHYTAAQSAQ